MADNTSGAKHLTSLDFDISAIKAQMEEIEKLLLAEGARLNSIVKNNWKISDIIGNGSAAKETETLNELIKKYSEVSRVITNLEKLKEQYANKSITLAEYEASAKKTIESVLQISVNTEKDKLNIIQQQTSEIGKQEQSYKQLTKTQQEQLAKIQAWESGTSLSSNSFVDKAKNYLTYRGLGYIERFAIDGFNEVKEIETAMMEISRVMGITDTQTASLKQNLMEISSEYGRNLDDVMEVAKRYAQAGYEVNEVIKMTEASMLALNTADLDVENSTQSLIGIMQQWGYTANDLITIIDKLNYTADNNAITTQDLVDGLLIASSVAKTANISFNDTVGVLTAMKEASGRSGKEVGSAFKSILAYIQRDSSLAAFEKMGIDVYADKATGTLNDMMSILYQMSEKWTGMSVEMQDSFIQSADMAELFNEDLAIALDLENEYIAVKNAETKAINANTEANRILAQASAGVYRRNYYIALLENIKKAIEVSGELDNALGYSATENSRYMDTLQAKIEQLIEALKELAVQAADAGLMDLAKGLVSAATSVAQLSKDFGGLRTVLIAVFAAMKFIQAAKLKSELLLMQSAAKKLNYTLDRTKVSAQKASISLNSMLGVIGIAVTVISAAVGWLQSYNEKQKRMREEAIEAAEASKQEFDELQDLIAQYEELGKKTQITAEEKQKLQDLQQQFIDKYGAEVEGINLVTGAYEEQIEILRQLSDEERERKYNANIAAQTSAKEDYEDSITLWERTLTGRTKGEERKAVANYINNSGMFRALSSGVSGIISATTDNPAEVLKEIRIAIKGLKELDLERTTAFTDLVDKETELSAAVNSYIESNNAVISDYEEQQKLTGEDYSEKINYYKRINIELTETLTGKTLEQISAEQQREYYVNQAKATYAALSDTTKDLAQSEEELNEELADIAAQSDELTKSIEENENEIQSLNGIISALNSGNALTANQVIDLIEKYPQLTAQIKKVENGYTLEKSAIEKLRDEQKEQALESMRQQIELTKETLIKQNERIKGYSDELMAIKSVSEGMALQAKIQSETLAKIKLLNGDLPQEERQKIYETNKAIDDIIKQYEVLEGYINLDLYNDYSSGTSSGNNSIASSASNAEKEVTALAKALEEFNTLQSFGIYTTSQQISKLEEFRRTLSGTADEIQTVENKLQSLYKEQIKERLSQIDEEQEARIDSIESAYDAEIEKINDLKSAVQESRDEEDYADKRAELLADLEYWRQRTGSDARENEEKTLKSLADLDKEYARKQEDNRLDSQLDAVEQRKDNEINVLKSQYTEMTELFDDYTVDLLSLAAIFVPKLYEKFKTLFTDPTKLDLEMLKSFIMELQNTVPNAVIEGTGRIPSDNTYPGATTSNPVVNSSITAGSKVKILSGATYTNGMAVPTQYIGKPYTVQQLKDGRALIQELFSWVPLEFIAKAKTGGYTLGEGLTYLHKNELVVNDELTRELRNLVIRNKTPIDKSESIIYQFNAPISNVEKQEISDSVDADVVAKKTLKSISKAINKKL